MADTESPRHPGHAAVRILWIFQAVIAAFLIILWVPDIVVGVNQPRYGADAYPVLRELALSILAASIVYTVIAQWKHPDPHPRVTARLELVKGLVATAMWAWLLLDAIFYMPRYPYYNDPYCRRRAVRITFSAWSIAIPCLCCLSPKVCLLV